MEHLKFINREVTESLDSSNSFEGPEKLLEVWFDAGSQDPGNGLLDVPQAVWTPMLDKVQCKVLSIVSFPKVDSYVLSESSFFVYQDHLVLKTCGTTTLLEGLAPILAIVREHTRLNPLPSCVFYSRRSFLFPDRQKGPHRSWSEEVKLLKSYFPHGQSLACGPNPSERWHLFEARTRSKEPVETIPTLEIMMSGLDPACAKLFYCDTSEQPMTPSPSPSPGESDGEVGAQATAQAAQNTASPTSLSPPRELASPRGTPSDVGAQPDDDDPGHHLGNVMTRIAGIDLIFPTKNQVVDSFAFSPCGYSCNAIVETSRFFTIHVTPEDGFSYASFGTNIVCSKFGVTIADVLGRVLDIFKPQRFEVAVFDGPEACLPEKVAGYTCNSELLHDSEATSMWYKSFQQQV